MVEADTVPHLDVEAAAEAGTKTITNDGASVDNSNDGHSADAKGQANEADIADDAEARKTAELEAAYGEAAEVDF